MAIKFTEPEQNELSQLQFVAITDTDRVKCIISEEACVDFGALHLRNDFPEDPPFRLYIRWFQNNKAAIHAATESLIEAQSSDRDAYVVITHL